MLSCGEVRQRLASKVPPACCPDCHSAGDMDGLDAMLFAVGLRPWPFEDAEALVCCNVAKAIANRIAGNNPWRQYPKVIP